MSAQVVSFQRTCKRGPKVRMGPMAKVLMLPPASDLDSYLKMIRPEDRARARELLQGMVQAMMKLPRKQ